MSYTSNTGLPKKTAKYQCVVSGAKRQAPCSGCPNPTDCVVKTMQYKESGIMNEMDQTPTVEMMDDGSVKCAKGLDASECGYKPGAKVCGKCGAVAVMGKSANFETGWVEGGKAGMGMGYGAAPGQTMKPRPQMAPMMDEEDEEVPMPAPATPMPAPRAAAPAPAPMRAPAPAAPAPAMGEGEDMGDDAMADDEMEDEKILGMIRRALKKRRGSFGKGDMMMGGDAMSMDDGDMEYDEEAEDEKILRLLKRMLKGKRRGKSEPMDGTSDDMYMMDDEDDEDEKMWGMISNALKRRKKARARRMRSMGVKSAQILSDENSFVCAIERKMYPGGSNICANCPGGCEPHGDMPTLLEIEGIAEDMFGGKILDSGYADQTDIFVVDVKRKDGKPIEAYFDGSSGECMGWHLLNENLIGDAAPVQAQKVISFDEAAAIAVKSIEGDVVAVDADLFEGYDAYAVEIEGVDGKSYDVFVGVDGEILGYDEYEPEEAAEIDAEVADLALKRMYSQERRQELAGSGQAMSDGSYPIVDEADLKNAIQAYGRAKDKEKAKKHIMKRARALKMEDMIPEEWMSDGKSLSDDEAKELLGSLIEFEMLTIEQGVEDPDKK